MTPGKLLFFCASTAFTVLLGACSDNKEHAYANSNVDTSDIQSLPTKLPTYITDPLRPVDNFDIPVHDLAMDGIIDKLRHSDSKATTKNMSQCWGDCDGSYKMVTDNGSRLTLHIFKRDCGDYGFGNEQYLLKDDTIIFVSLFNISLTDDTTNQVFISEEYLYDLRKDPANEKMRSKTFSNPNDDHRLDAVDFLKRRHNRDSLTTELKKQLIDALELAKNGCQ
jgi:hypothetical protein